MKVFKGFAFYFEIHRRNSPLRRWQPDAPGGSAPAGIPRLQSTRDGPQRRTDRGARLSVWAPRAGLTWDIPAPHTPGLTLEARELLRSPAVGVLIRTGGRNSAETKQRRERSRHPNYPTELFTSRVSALISPRVSSLLPRAPTPL